MAQALYDWLPQMLQSVEPWMSSEDIRSGGRWLQEMTTELESRAFGIACLTSDNLDAPWIHFEAGAISKTVGTSWMAPVLLDIQPSAVTGPLSSFQAVLPTSGRMLKLLKDIRDAGELAVSDAVIEKAHEKFWSDLHAEFERIRGQSPPATGVKREVSEMVEEILDLIRAMSRTSELSGPAVLDPRFGAGSELSKLLHVLKRSESSAHVVKSADVRDADAANVIHRTLREAGYTDFGVMHGADGSLDVSFEPDAPNVDARLLRELDEIAARFRIPELAVVLPQGGVWKTGRDHRRFTQG